MSFCFEGFQEMDIGILLGFCFKQFMSFCFEQYVIYSIFLLAVENIIITAGGVIRTAESI